MNQSGNPPWAKLLADALEAEFGRKPWVCTLATVDESGSPRARSIVCRRVDVDGTLVFVSDARSEKKHQVRATPKVEVVFWLPTKREQYRLAGDVVLLQAQSADKRHLALWRSLSDASRALFFWPAAGSLRRSDDVFVEKIGIEFAPPDSFEVLLLSPARVDTLDLNQHPHRRMKWFQDGSVWQGRLVNP